MWTVKSFKRFGVITGFGDLCSSSSGTSGGRKSGNNGGKDMLKDKEDRQVILKVARRKSLSTNTQCRGVITIQWDFIPKQIHRCKTLIHRIEHGA